MGSPLAEINGSLRMHNFSQQIASVHGVTADTCFAGQQNLGSSPGKPAETTQMEASQMRKLIPVVGPLLAAVVAMVPIVGAILAGILA
jgi:hypothetical protein